MFIKNETTGRLGPRGILFRLAAILLGLLPFVVIEVVLTLLGWGTPDYHDDPFLGFSSIRPLFVLNQSEDAYEIPRGRQKFFRPESFAAQKGADEFRIFCLGGSTVQGRPFAIETSFTTWLELGLQAADPGRRWEVVNCGGVSYASYRLVPILQEILSYQPDYVIVYTGHNEFLEDRTYSHIKNRQPLLTAAQEAASRLRTFTLIRAGYLRLRGHAPTDSQKGRPTVGTEVSALLDYRGGMEAYHWDEKWRDDVVSHYRYNLRRLVEISRQAGVPLLLVNPVSNLRDCPPFRAEQRDDLTSAEIQQFQTLWSEAREMYKTDLRGAVDQLQQASEIDDRHAGLWYDLAKCLDALGRIPEAREAYMRANDYDVCPLRVLQSMNQAVLDVARQTDTPVVDAQQLFAGLSRDGIPGGFLLVDHVHPSIHGHQLIANELLEQLASSGFVDPRDDWEQDRDTRFEKHLASLEKIYFLQGEEQLRSLRGWAQGRATLEPPAPDPP